jgi:hypothetical protein
VADLPFVLVGFKDTAQSSIPKLVEIVVNDEDANARAAGLEALAALAEDGVFNSIISSI